MGMAILGSAEEDGWSDWRGSGYDKRGNGYTLRYMTWRCSPGSWYCSWLWLPWLLNSICCHIVPFVESKDLSANTFALQLRICWIPQMLQNLAKQSWKEKWNGISSLQLLLMHLLFKIEKGSHN